MSLSGWPDTPDGRGLLPVARDEVGIALQHAEYAQLFPTDIESIRLHSGHVLHAVDPLAIEGGPGLGYGLENAAAGVAVHIAYAAADDASDDVKTHAEHVTTSARNVTVWTNGIVRLISQVNTNDTAKHANIMAGRVRHLLVCVVIPRVRCDSGRYNILGIRRRRPGADRTTYAIDDARRMMMRGEGLD